ncbi:MAG TPA: NADH-quinone oxidoreductase subunit C [Methanoregulaceae archaeon]|nr:NADH-quinone oxidoreductase subunit C [Methanoregulaceae archaeon]
MNQPISIETINEAMKGMGTAEMARSNRIRVTTGPETIHEALTVIMGSLGCDRLITISTADNGTAFELFYHLTGPHRTIISLGTKLSREMPKIASVSDILLSAGIYERQIHDLFGIEFLGHPGLKRIILNEDWPADEFPLRKDWKRGPDTFYGGIKEEKI